MEILLGCGGFDREAGMKIYQIKIDFPTSAQGIAQWLNLRFTRDNG
jgi:hypothetical protein